MRTLLFGDLSAEGRELVLAAEGMTGRAYAPYSGFHVGAALRVAGSGEMVGGANVENASYGLCLCAERAALVRGNAEGRRVFSSLAVIGRRGDARTGGFTAPCGACRQMIYEAATLGDGDMEILLPDGGLERVLVTSIRELLPLAFGPGSLGGV